jgi:hypothetical protein
MAPQPTAGAAALLGRDLADALSPFLPFSVEHRTMAPMLIGRIFGWLLLFAAGIVLVRDGLVWIDLHAIAPLSLAGLWTDLGAAGFRAARASVEHIAPWLWTRGIGPLLSLWALPSFAVLGLALLWSCRTRPRRYRY